MESSIWPRRLRHRIWPRDLPMGAKSCCRKLRTSSPWRSRKWWRRRSVGWKQAIHRRDAENAEKAQRSGEIKERSSAETAEGGGLRFGTGGVPERRHFDARADFADADEEAEEGSVPHSKALQWLGEATVD